MNHNRLIQSRRPTGRLFNVKPTKDLPLDLCQYIDYCSENGKVVYKYKSLYFSSIFI